MPIAPVEVAGGPIFENVMQGDDVDLFRFPAPQWNELDGGRFLGTGTATVTRDPEDGWVNLGTYRNQIMGRNLLASEATNCAAPDTGNMEVLAEFGTPEQQEEWLVPLLAGEIRSCFAMTEPWVASSDATNIQSRIVRDGDHYVVNAHKWWTSGALSPRCKVAIVMGKTDTSAKRHQQQSMILMPMDAPGVTIERMLTVYGYDHAPLGHGEVEALDHAAIDGDDALVGVRGRGEGLDDAPGRHTPDAIDVGQTDLDLFLPREIDASNTSHVCLALPLLVLGIALADDASHTAAGHHLAVLTDRLDARTNFHR